jgi:primosomal protein N' (replication factor Y)
MYVEVALPLPVHRTFTYEVPAGTVIGTRVRVPFAGRRLIGWVAGPADAARDVERVLPVDAVLEPSPSVPDGLMRLCRWTADYYLTPLGVVLRAALPAGLSRPGRRPPASRTRRVLRLTAELPSLTGRDATFGRATRQRACFEYVEAAGGRADVRHLTERLGFSRTVLRSLVARRLAVFEDEAVERDPFAALPSDTGPPPVPTAAQAAAIRAILDGEDGRRPTLLLGVTGSGKTLVYLEVLERVVGRDGRGAIVLVPEIALTPQTVARFRGRFGDTVAVLHSALSDGERYDAWRALREGRRRIAIGARSAVFAPIADIGAIIVDEEHEATYKQSEAPRYHARELAIVRAAFHGAVCVLGSATPSLESWHNVERGKFHKVELPARVGDRPLPPVRVIDLRSAPRGDGQRAVLTEPLVTAVEERLACGEQTILLLNRRGYSSFVQCRACGDVWHCPHCNVSLTWHRSRRRLLCHYCMHEKAPPSVCGACGSDALSYRGVGTEQVEREVARTFPAARIARMDVDTTSARWAHHEILSRFGAGEIDILLGTQMIAKGLDFPGVTLVGVVDADVAMNLPDFRASERTFQLLTQVAGRAGRGPAGGAVLVQTSLPHHYAIACAVRHDVHGFLRRETDERRAPGYPPHTRLLNVVISGADEGGVVRAAVDASGWVEAVIRRTEPGRVVLTGPAPCPVDRIRGRWRWHFLLRSAAPGALGRVGRALATGWQAPAGAGEVRIVVDRDPVTLL